MKTNLLPLLSSHTSRHSATKTSALITNRFKCKSGKKGLFAHYGIMFLLLLIIAPAARATENTGLKPEFSPGFENLPPVAICRSTPLIIYLSNEGTAELIASQLDGGSYDPENGPVHFVTRSVSYTCSDIGPHEVTLIVLDDIGQSSECNTTVIVADNIPPVARCKDIAVLPDDKGDYNLVPSDLDNGSTDNCGIKSMSVTPAFIPCVHQAYQQLVTLSVTDSSGNTGTCTSYVQLQGDSDCDGVGDLCDLCPGGNDQIDNNNDGQPDCAVFPGKANIPGQWYCGNKCNLKVLICHIPPGNPENRHTICVSINAVPAHLAHGDYLGPCDEAVCDPRANEARSAEAFVNETEEIRLYPNPAASLVYLDFTTYSGSPAVVTVYNNLGKKVLIRQFAELPEGQFMIQVENYPEGLYFARIDGDDFSKLIKFEVKR